MKGLTFQSGLCPPSNNSFIEEQIELETCRNSVTYWFTHYVFIQDRLRGIIRWEDWPYLLNLLDTFTVEKDVVIIKARQLGITWLVAGYVTWKALFTDGAKILLFSQGEVEAWELIDKCKFIWSRLPDYMKLSLDHESRNWLSFAANKSEIKAYPSTEKAGRSTDATIVVRDELEYHPYGKENYSSVRPTIDAGGQLIDLSTINKSTQNSHFHERVRKAQRREGGAKLVFLSWKLRPVRKEGMTIEDWFNDNIKPNYEPWQIEQEYPSKLEDCMSALQTRMFFNKDALDSMQVDCSDEYLIRSPAPQVNDFNGVVRVYKLPVPDRKYCIYTDPSGGSEDPFVTVVLDLQTWDTVADAVGKFPVDRAASVHDSLVRSYNNAYNSYEKNAWAGGKFEEHLVNLDTPNQSPFIKPDGTTDDKKHGIWASIQMKRKMLAGLEEAIRSRLVRVHNKEAWNQFNGFIIPVNKDGTSGEPMMSIGMHDDFISAYAGAWELMKFAPMMVGSVRSYHQRSQ